MEKSKSKLILIGIGYGLVFPLLIIYCRIGEHFINGGNTDLIHVTKDLANDYRNYWRAIFGKERMDISIKLSRDYAYREFKRKGLPIELFNLMEELHGSKFGDFYWLRPSEANVFKKKVKNSNYSRSYCFEVVGKNRYDIEISNTNHDGWGYSDEDTVIKENVTLEELKKELLKLGK